MPENKELPVAGGATRAEPAPVLPVNACSARAAGELHQIYRGTRTGNLRLAFQRPIFNTESQVRSSRLVSTLAARWRIIEE